MALKPNKLRDSGLEELEQEEKALREQIWKLQLQRSTGQVADPHKTRAARKDLARVLTIRRERERSASKGRQG